MSVRTLVNTAYAAITQHMEASERDAFDGRLAAIDARLKGALAGAPAERVSHPLLRSVPNDPQGLMRQMAQFGGQPG